MPKAPLTVLEAELSLPEIASALRITEDDALTKFRDPRITSWFAEIWGERLFSYKKHLNSNHPGSDAAIQLGAMGRFEISVRSFYKGNVKFQKSKFIGSGRGATLEDLIVSVESVERVVVVDLRGFPLLRFIPVDSKPLLRLIHEKKLGTSGMTPRRFDAWLTNTFEMFVQRIVLTS